MQRNKLSEKAVFEVSPPGGNFSASVKYDGHHIIEEVERTKQETETSVIQSLQARVDTVSQSQQDRLDTELTSDAPTVEGIREVVRDVFRQAVGETDDIEQRKAELEAELEDVERQADVYRPAIQLFQEVNNLRESWSAKNSEFEQGLSKHDQNTDQAVSTGDEEYVYVKNIKPNDIFRATGSTNIADSDMFANAEENQRLRSNLEEMAKNARNQQYAGLRRRKLSKGTSRYDELKVRLAVSSPAISDIDPDILDFEETFRGAYDLGGAGKRVESPFTSWQKEMGGPWDISLSVFITGVFLDNIRKVVQADGYHAGYEHQREELGANILVHHSYGLEEGYYVRRNDLLNMENGDDVEFFLRNEGDIVNDLLDNYIDVIDHT
jgi:hypothetical protein